MSVAFFGSDAAASEIRGMSPPPPTAEVAATVAAVAADGDAAVAELEMRFGANRWPAVVEAAEIAAAPQKLDPAMLAALELAIANVRRAAESSLAEATTLKMPQGHEIHYRHEAVRRAAAYVPGGRGSYPSTAVMCLTTAVVAGVDEVCVLSPAREHGGVDTAVLAVCSLLGVDEVYRVGGAQAIAAAALGTQTIAPVDVIVGPGNSYVQEAKRQLIGRVGIDSVAGPSELVVVGDDPADAELIALDLLAQAEHGPDSLVVLVSPDAQLRRAVAERCSDISAELAIVEAPDTRAAVRLADELAPEHMQLMLAEDAARSLAGEVTRAGALFVGRWAATAFGDYVLGSNHVLPTGGSAGHASALSVQTFMRRMAELHVPQPAATALADAGATIARGEGFPMHAESMEARRQ